MKDFRVVIRSGFLSTYQLFLHCVAFCAARHVNEHPHIPFMSNSYFSSFRTKICHSIVHSLLYHFDSISVASFRIASFRFCYFITKVTIPGTIKNGISEKQSRSGGHNRSQAEWTPQRIWWKRAPRKDWRDYFVQQQRVSFSTIFNLHISLNLHKSCFTYHDAKNLSNLRFFFANNENLIRLCNPVHRPMSHLFLEGASDFSKFTFKLSIL